MSRELVRAYVDRLPAGPSPDRLLFRLGAGEAGGQFYGARLSSVFQRVVTADGRELGHQGLVRCRSADDATLSPWRLFADTATDDELVQLDRLARTLHALNYFGVAQDDARLLLAVEQRLLEAVAGGHGQHFARILSRFGVPASRVVITLPPATASNLALLADVLPNYRHAGYDVAVRLPELDPELAARLALLRPQAVRVKFADAGETLWREIVAAVGGGGAALHVTHVERPAELDRLADYGAGWLQGHAVGAAGDLPRPRGSTPPLAGLQPRQAVPAENPRPARFTRMQQGDLELPIWTPMW